MRFAGIETPLSDRAMKELSKKKTGLFRTSGLDITVSNKLAQMSDTRVSVPVLISRGSFDIQ